VLGAAILCLPVIVQKSGKWVPPDAMQMSDGPAALRQPETEPSPPVFELVLPVPAKTFDLPKVTMPASAPKMPVPRAATAAGTTLEATAAKNPAQANPVSGASTALTARAKLVDALLRPHKPSATLLFAAAAAAIFLMAVTLLRLRRRVHQARSTVDDRLIQRIKAERQRYGSMPA
jgi:hypothetical protein